MAKLLIIADMGRQCAATPRGLELAARLGLAVDVVAFTHAPLGGLNIKAGEKANLRKRLLDEREQTVQALIDTYRRDGQKVSLRTVWEKDLQPWINKRCAGGAYVAVVKTGHRSESLVHTSLDWQLLRECPAPVLIVAEKKWHRTRPVLATLDLGSSAATKRSLNRRVLETAKALAEALGVELEIITAIEVPVLLADLDLVDPGTYAREAQAAMQPRIAELAKAFDVPQESFHCKRGPVERVIASQAAKVGAQIVVMGTVGRTGVKARLLGNTAEKVLGHLKTDVLAIKP
ncbi:MAG: universal stress protein [Halieaceae bacterium]|jgi:universal stress protein E|nr:universal stress protein [Halieaceae bacterium]